MLNPDNQILIDFANKMIKIGIVFITIGGLFYVVGKFVFGENSKITTFIWLMLFLFINTNAVVAVCH